MSNVLSTFTVYFVVGEGCVAALDSVVAEALVLDLVEGVDELDFVVGLVVEVLDLLVVFLEIAEQEVEEVLESVGQEVVEERD